MAETDVFERRLRAALVRHTDGGPTDFDALGFARLVAEQEPRRHGLGAVLGWRAAGVPRLAWVLLLAGLLTAMVAGTLAVGAQLRRRDPAVVPPVVAAFVCPPGSNPDAPGPVGQERPVIGDGIADMAFDRGAGRVVLLAQLGTRAETWTFDVCTNAWTRMHPEQEPGSPLSSSTHLIYDADSDATIAIDGQSTWVYDLAKDTWTRMGVVPVVRQWNVLTWTYDPVSGLVIAADAGELWSYDVEADAWASISPVPWRAGLERSPTTPRSTGSSPMPEATCGSSTSAPVRGRGRVPTRRWSYAPWDGPTLRSSTTRRHGGRSSPATSAPCTTSTLRTTRPRIAGSPSPRTAGASVLRVRPGQQAPRRPRRQPRRHGRVPVGDARADGPARAGPGAARAQFQMTWQAGRRERLKGDGMNAGGTADRLLVGLAVMILAGACASGAQLRPRRRPRRVHRARSPHRHRLPRPPRPRGRRRASSRPMTSRMSPPTRSWCLASSTSTRRPRPVPGPWS